MICTSVIPRLSSGLAENNRIMSMFVLFSRRGGWPFCKAGFFGNGDKPFNKAVKHDVFSQFFKGTTFN